MNTNETLIKVTLIFGGGFLLFMLLKPKSAISKTSVGDKTSFDATPAPTKDNADIVAKAYTSAVNNNETPAKLTELNGELLKEFGMTCSISNGQTIVKDSKGETVITQ